MDTFTAVYTDPHMVFTFSGGTTISYTASLLSLVEDVRDGSWILASGDANLGTTILDWNQMTAPAGAVSRTDAINKINALVLPDEYFDVLNVTTLNANTIVSAATFGSNNAANDTRIVLGDAAGATVLVVQDSTTASVFSIDSLGLVTMPSLTASRIVATDANGVASSVANLASWVTGTANRVTVTNDGDGTVTLSTPQDIATTSSPTFASLTLTKRFITSGVVSLSTSVDGSPQGAIDVTNVSVVMVSPDTGDFRINGFANGIAYQRILVVKAVDANNLILTYNSAGGTQKILCQDGKDITLPYYGAVSLLYTGSLWFVEEQSMKTINTQMNITDSTASVSTVTGAVVLAGGLGVGGNITAATFTPAAVPAITGSRGGNAALASLLTGLASIGLITDTSTP